MCLMAYDITLNILHTLSYLILTRGKYCYYWASHRCQETKAQRNKLALGFTISIWQSCNSNPGYLAPEFLLLISMLYGPICRARGKRLTCITHVVPGSMEYTAQIAGLFSGEHRLGHQLCGMIWKELSRIFCPKVSSTSCKNITNFHH